MTDPASRVFVVDDDASVRDGVSNLLEAVGLSVSTFGSAEDVLQNLCPEDPGCLVLDVKLPGANGLEFQQRLAHAGIDIPIVFVTAHGDIPMTARAIKAGAIEFLTKPFEKNQLLAAIRQGLEQDRIRREERSEMASLQSRYQALTSREREVMDLVTTGLMNKQVAAQLCLSEVTVKIYRRQVMQKMVASSLAELVRMADKLKSFLSGCRASTPPRRTASDYTKG